MKYSSQSVAQPQETPAGALGHMSHVSAPRVLVPHICASVMCHGLAAAAASTNSSVEGWSLALVLPGVKHHQYVHRILCIKMPPGCMFEKFHGAPLWAANQLN